jgi:hypothetical protein
MAAQSQKRASLAAEWSKHPLVVLLFATLLGSVLIPFVNTRIERDRRLHELKSQRSREILQTSRDIDRKLTLVCTEFINFHKDKHASLSAAAQARESLRTRVYRLYEDFNRDAWWWHWQLLEESSILGLVDDASHPQLEQSVRDYHKALVASADALDPVWAALLREPDSRKPKEVGRVIEDAMSRIRQLADQRRQSVREMVSLILR